MADLVLNVSDSVDVEDSNEPVIPSWLDKVYIGDDVYYIIILRVE